MGSAEFILGFLSIDVGSFLREGVGDGDGDAEGCCNVTIIVNIPIWHYNQNVNMAKVIVAVILKVWVMEFLNIDDIVYNRLENKLIVDNIYVVKTKQKPNSLKSNCREELVTWR